MFHLWGEVKKMIDEVEEQLNHMLSIADRQMPAIAKIMRKFYVALLQEGFTAEEAIQLCKNYTVK